MTASIDVTGLATFSKSLRRAVTGDLQKALVKNIQDNERPILADMRGHEHTKIQRRALGSVTFHRTTAGLDIAGGQGSGLGATLFDGAEYGGRKSKKVTYATRSRRGKAYVVRRRTTMQFLPHLGREGYFFWPAVRDGMKRLSKEQDALVEKALG